MGWPKKNETYRLYKDTDGSYFMIQLDEETLNPDRSYTGLANVIRGKEPSLTTTSIHPNYIARHWLKRIQWDELPNNWQIAFRDRWFDQEPKENPYEIRGFWRVENFKERR